MNLFAAAKELFKRGSSATASQRAAGPQTPTEVETELTRRLTDGDALQGVMAEAFIDHTLAWLKEQTNGDSEYAASGYPFIYSQNTNNMNDALGVVEKMISYTKTHAPFALETTCQLLASTFCGPKVIARCLEATDGTETYSKIFDRAASNFGAINTRGEYRIERVELTEVLAHAARHRNDLLNRLVYIGSDAIARVAYKYEHAEDIARARGYNPMWKERMDQNEAALHVAMIKPLLEACRDTPFNTNDEVSRLFWVSLDLLPVIRESHVPSAAALAAELLLSSAHDEAWNTRIYKKILEKTQASDSVPFFRSVLTAMAAKIDMQDGGQMQLPGEHVLVLRAMPESAPGFAAALVSPTNDQAYYAYVPKDPATPAPARWQEPFMRTVAEVSSARVPQTLAAFLAAKRPQTTATLRTADPTPKA